MATIDEIYQLLKYRATKGGFNGNISPNDFNLIWPRAEIRFFNSKYKTYLINQDNSDSLLTFKTDPLPISIDGNGKYIKPNDVLHIDAIRRNIGTVEVEVVRVEDDRLGNHLNSSYAPPTPEFPIYTEYKTYLQFNPKTISNATLVYLQRTQPSKWGYTLVNGRPVYDPNTSIQPRYDETDLDEVLYIALSDIAINMKDQQLEAFAERKIQTEK